MDSLTHIALGACVGGLLGGKQLRTKALVWGAAAQSLPDIDFLAGIWCSPAEDLLTHRGFTHSFLFMFLLAPLLAIGAQRLHGAARFSLIRWMIFFAVQISIHLLLDALNVYGTGWWEPFSHHRVSGNLLFVADPVMTLPLVIAAGWLFFTLRRDPSATIRPVVVAFLICFAYLFLGLFSKMHIEKELQQQCRKKGLQPVRSFVTPAPFTSLLWFCAVDVGQGFYVGYRSVFDQEKSGFSLTFFPKQDSLLAGVHDREDVQHLIRFSKGYYIVQRRTDTLVFNDLRFGQQMGWAHPRAPFSFYYFLEHPGQNDFLIQRGRLAGWDHHTFTRYIDRIVANP